MTLQIIKHSKLWLGISCAILALATLSMLAFGINGGLDFTGGARMTLQFAAPVTHEQLVTTLKTSGYDPLVQASEGGMFVVRVAELDDAGHAALLAQLTSTYGDVDELEYVDVDPIIGNELKRKALWASVLVLGFIAAYVAWAFRHVSEPVASWKYGVVTLVAALHDVVIPLGVLALLGKVLGYSVDAAFVAAVLTILGYSINDTIVVFDRTRENLYRNRHADASFGDVVNKNINETLGRSLNTTMTTLLPLIAIVIFGGESTRPFAITLLAGILSGAYSSIFVASPLLVLSEKWGKK